MAKADNEDILETYNNMNINDIFYERDVGITNSKSSNNPKSLVSGGYDSGVDCVSCKSSEGSTINNETNTIVEGSNKYIRSYLGERTGVESANREQSFEDRSIIQPEPGPKTTSLHNYNFTRSQYCQTNYGCLVVFFVFLVKCHSSWNRLLRWNCVERNCKRIRRNSFKSFSHQFIL